MKLRKITLIFAIILILTCFFAACDEAPEGDVTERVLLLDDFVYETEIDTAHVITEDELAAINQVWLSEYGKKFAETPDEAMKKQREGDFFYGRYGKIFVFYKKAYDMDMNFGWGKHDFTLPRGEYYFVSGRKVYTREEIAATDMFTAEYIDAFYDCYKNSHLTYTPEIVLREGEYVLTGADLVWMHELFEHSAKFTGVDTLDNAMRREKNSAYYFGKFGDTVIIWNLQNYSEKQIFTLCGYEFRFFNGALLFFDPTGLYKPETEGVEGIMTAEEWQAFYDHYVEYYVPLNSDPYTVLEFIPELEKLTEDEMKKIDEAYEEWNYDNRYSYYYEMYIAAKQTPAEAAKNADSAAYSRMGYDPHRFFREGNYKNYQYFGKKGSKIFLAVQDTYNALTVFEAAGYKFVLDGAESNVFVYENGKVTPIFEAYENGSVTKSDVAFAHERHLAYSQAILGGKEEVPPPAKLKIATSANLPEDLVREIVWEYIAGADEGELDYTYSVRCFGKFGEAYAVMIDGPFMYTQAMRTEVIAGYTFTFPDGQRMYIYKEGNFYTLLKAYELGVISEEDIVAIAWAKTLPYTYETTTAPIQMDEQTVSHALCSYAEEYALHKKGGAYSMRCYAEVKYGYAVFVDCSDKEYPQNRTVETVEGYEFIYPTEQTMLICYNWGEFATLADALKYEWLTEAELKTVWEAYRTAFPELYK